MAGFQCEKQLWLKFFKPELEAATSASTQMQFDEGHEVGFLAQKHFGTGAVVECDYWDYAGAVQKTLDFIAAGETTIFEASFRFGSFFSRADIFSFNKKAQAWDVIEVKKSTSVKEYHLLDSAIQTCIILNSGFKVNSVSLMHINNQCEYTDLKNLFVTEDISSEVMALIPMVEGKANLLLKILTKKTEPKIKIGRHCSEPFACPFEDHCFKDVPEKSVFDLPTVGVKAWEYYNQGLTQITQLDENDFKNTTKRAIEVTKKNKLWIDANSIQAELKTWIWPLYFFDFETIAPAIPRYEKTKPYSKVPFQFSCHVWPSNKSKLAHFEYLHSDTTDPRPNLIKAMLAGFGDSGSIVAYNKSFEMGVITKLAEFDPKNSRKLLKLIDRFVDPLPIFRKYTYHPDYLGSFSIKSVAPALLGSALKYEGLDVASGLDAQVYADLLLRGRILDGGAAVNRANDVHNGAGDIPVSKEQVIQSLLTYCRQDTLAMVELVRWLMAQK